MKHKVSVGCGVG